MVQLILFTLGLKHLIQNFLWLEETQPIVESNLKWDGRPDCVYRPRGKVLSSPRENLPIHANAL